MIVLNLVYNLGKGTKEEFLEKVFENNIPEKTNNEPGCLYYEFWPAYEGNRVFLVENWKDQAALDNHKEQDHLKKLLSFKDEFGITTDFSRYDVAD